MVEKRRPGWDSILGSRWIVWELGTDGGCDGTERQGQQLTRRLYRQEAYPLGSISIIASEKAMLLTLSAALGTCGPMPEEAQLPACPQHCQSEEAESQGSWWMFQSPHSHVMARFT